MPFFAAQNCANLFGQGGKRTVPTQVLLADPGTEPAAGGSERDAREKRERRGGSHHRYHVPRFIAAREHSRA
jgi:hypothetical protein